MAPKKDWAGRLIWADLVYEDRNHYVDEYVFGNPYRERVPYYMTRLSTPELIGERFDDVFLEYLEPYYDEDLRKEFPGIWRCSITHHGAPEVTAYGDTENDALCFCALRAVGVYVTRK